MSGLVEAEQSFDLTADSPARGGLITMLKNNTANTNGSRIILPHLFPKFLKVKNLGDLKPVPQLLSKMPENSPKESYYRNLTLILHEDKLDKWWEVLEECSDELYNNTFSKLPYADCGSSAVLYTFSDKLFPATLSWLTAGG